MPIITIPSGPLQGVKLEVAQARWNRRHRLLHALRAVRRTRPPAERTPADRDRG